VRPLLHQSILPATLFLLLSVVVFPVNAHSVAEKASSLSDRALSSAVFPLGCLDVQEGDDHEISVTTAQALSHLPAAAGSFYSIPANVLEFAHTVSQARAPPLH
jgi:hypothetical protein